MCHVAEMAMGIKIRDRTNDAKKNAIIGVVKYDSEHQRKLHYTFEKVAALGPLLMTGPKEGDSEVAFPGFVWTILMKR